MSALDRLTHLEQENARLEADNVQLLHDKHQAIAEKDVAIAERDRARDVAANLEADYALLDMEAGVYAVILQMVACEEPVA